MSQIVIGNIIAFIASIIMTYLGLLKSKKKMIFLQTVQIGLFVISNLILGGMTGAIVNAISFVRNILCYKDKLGLKEKIVITILSVVFALVFNNLGVIGLLPLLSTILYLWLMTLKDVVKFKLLLILTMVLWLIYDITIKSYTSAVFDFMSIIFNVISIVQIRRKGRC